jgi:hypothetical protein
MINEYCKKRAQLRPLFDSATFLYNCQLRNSLDWAKSYRKLDARVEVE